MSEISIEVAGVHRASHLLFELRCELERERAKLNEVIVIDDDDGIRGNRTHVNNKSAVDKYQERCNVSEKEHNTLCKQQRSDDTSQICCAAEQENIGADIAQKHKVSSSDLSTSKCTSNNKATKKECHTLREAIEQLEEEEEQPLSLAEVSRVAEVVNMSSHLPDDDHNDTMLGKKQECNAECDATYEPEKVFTRVVTEEERKAASMVQKSRFAQREYERILQLLVKQRKEREMLSSYELYERNAYADLWALGWEAIYDEAKEHRKESALLMRERIARAYWHKRIRQRREELEQRVNDFETEGVLHDDDLLRLMDMKMSFEYWTSQLPSFYDSSKTNEIDHRDNNINADSDCQKDVSVLDDAIANSEHVQEEHLET